ncbi:hypothetical protein B0H14DRAFT_3546697 [Mycena olivaceomarginata]|nr:hypothetical protein B0H14DRAFT_3546697 [Mycena olivaceomarginata]
MNTKVFRIGAMTSYGPSIISLGSDVFLKSFYSKYYREASNPRADPPQKQFVGALREKCQRTHGSSPQLPEDQSNAHIPIFCVGSCDYLSLSRLLPTAPLVFSMKEDVRICSSSLHDLNPTHVPPGDSVGPEMQQEIVDLESAVTDRTLTLVQSVDVIFKRIAAEVVKAVNVAQKRSPTVFERIAQLKWNQYLALMRRDGEYGPTDVNADLTAPILPSVQTQWYLGVNVEIPALLSVFFGVLQFLSEKGTQLNYKQELKVDLDNTIQTLQVRSSTNIRKIQI